MVPVRGCTVDAQKNRSAIFFGAQILNLDGRRTWAASILFKWLAPEQPGAVQNCPELLWEGVGGEV